MSTGASLPSEVVAEAKSVGLDFLILTDTGQLSGTDTVSGYYDNLMVLNQNEFNYTDSRILSIHQDHKPSFDSVSELNLYLTDRLSQISNESSTELFILAHPFNPEPTWSGAYPSGLQGLEVLNSKAISQKGWLRSKPEVLWSVLTLPFNSHYSFLRLFREPSEELALWDELAAQRKTLGFSGLDATARAIPIKDFPIRFPSYAKSFELMSNHVLLSSELTGNFQKDRDKIFQALRNGNFYMAVDILGDPKGFLAKIEDKDSVYLMGSEIQFKPNLKLEVSLPSKPFDFFEIIVYRNGERMHTSNEVQTEYIIPEKGQYRVQVRVSPRLPLPDGKKWISWIYTNHFYIK
jgi:hypothetical protein